MSNVFKEYSIEKNGDLYSYKNNKKTKLLGRIDKNGYKVYGLRVDGPKKWYKAHRLVAQAYIPNPDNKPQVDHIDGDKQNNNVDNLRWCTNLENNNFDNQNFKTKQCKYIGVRKTASGRFNSRITIDGKRVNVGTFNTQEEARDERNKICVHNFK